MMKNVTIYHNPHCSKSREALSLLEQQGIKVDTVLYMTAPLSVATLRELLRQLGFSDARQLMRTKEAAYQTLQLANPELSQEQLSLAMTEHPELIERPIVVYQGQARVGRPLERINEILH